MMQNTTKQTKIVLFLLQMVPLISFILFITYTIPKNQKGKGYVSKDFILDSVQIKTDPAQREDENDSTGTISQKPQHVL
jgi:hypothetical protein